MPEPAINAHAIREWSSSFSEADRDELIRLQFRCAALERRLQGESELRAAVASLQEQVLYLSSQLAATRSERDRFASALRSTAALNRSTLEQILALDVGNASSEGATGA